MKQINLFILFSLFFTSLVCAQNPQWVGHRGSTWGVESTQDAFVHGAAHYQLLETDIKVTADSQFVCIHDDHFLRLGQQDSMIVNRHTLAQLRALELRQERRGETYIGRLCTLQEYLMICRQYGRRAVVELKWATGINSHDQSLLPALLDTIAAYGMTDQVIILTSMRPCLEWIRTQSAYPNMQLQWLCTPKNEAEHMEWCRQLHIDVDMMKGFDQQVVERWHQAGLVFNCWTINDPDEVQTLIQMGVDYITTDCYLAPN